jgi:hypothetical protein
MARDEMVFLAGFSPPPPARCGAAVFSISGMLVENLLVGSAGEPTQGTTRLTNLDINEECFRPLLLLFPLPAPPGFIIDGVRLGVSVPVPEPRVGVSLWPMVLWGTGPPPSSVAASVAAIVP